MKSAIESMRARQSVRDGFQRVPVPIEQIETIVECGLRAPSSKNAQPWRMHVVTDEVMLNAIADAVISAEGKESYVPADPLTGESRNYVSTVVESALVLKEAPLGIFIENLGVFSRSRRDVADSPREHRENVLLGFSFEILGIGAAIENMWIAAVELGLAGVFMGDIVIAEPFVKEALHFSGDLVGALALGPSQSRALTPKPALDGRVIHW